jgi:hypothetical protein
MMTDDELTELIAAIVAARADGDGVLTIAAVRARLEAAKLYVVRLEDSGERDPERQHRRSVTRTAEKTSAAT